MYPVLGYPKMLCAYHLLSAALFCCQSSLDGNPEEQIPYVYLNMPWQEEHPHCFLLLNPGKNV